MPAHLTRTSWLSLELLYLWPWHSKQSLSTSLRTLPVIIHGCPRLSTVIHGSTVIHSTVIHCPFTTTRCPPPCQQGQARHGFMYRVITHRQHAFQTLRGRKSNPLNFNVARVRFVTGAHVHLVIA